MIAAACASTTSSATFIASTTTGASTTRRDRLEERDERQGGAAAVGEGEVSTRFDTAQICLNGHIINPATEAAPHDSQDFCSACGATTIVRCTDCDAAIRGARLAIALDRRWHPTGGLARQSAPPKFCTTCGKPYPWTRATLDAARELAAELHDLSESERADLVKSLPDLIADTPKTTVAATRFKRLMVKAGADAGAAFRKILVDVVTEGAKRTIWS